MRQVRAALSGFAPGLIFLMIAALGAAIISGILAMHVVASPRGHAGSAGTTSAGSTSMAVAVPMPMSMPGERTPEADTATVAGAQLPPGHDAMAIACALALLAAGILLLAAAVRRSAWSDARVAMPALPRLPTGSRGPPDLNVLCVCRT